MATLDMLKTFRRGGVHPGDSKQRTCDLPIQRSQQPAQVAVLMAQHIGAPAAPVVKKKDAVKKGQLVGEARGYISANIHSPVSGTVKAVEPHTYGVTGTKVMAVVIESDGEDQWAEGLNEPQDVESMEVQQMVDLVQECGIVGMGGATFPAHVKLNPPPHTPVRDVFINGAECEPYVTVDHRLMLERPEDVVDGLKLIMRMVGASNGYVGIESNKPDAIQTMAKALEGERGIDVVPLKVKYPQGSEQQLITAVTGREVPNKGGLPSDVACLVHNVATTLAIRDAVRMRKPLIERAVTVTGEGIGEAGNFIELVGTNVADILERQGAAEDANQLIMGGPMMGIAQAGPQLPLVKGNNCIILRRGASVPEQRACIRCGRCVAHCPLGLMPGEMSVAMERQDWDGAIGYGMLECKECGCCAYVCPARRRIVHMTKFGKAELRRKKQQESR